MEMLKKLRGLHDTLGRFSNTFYTGDNFCDFQFAFMCIKPLLKIKGKKLLPEEPNSFSSRADPFKMGK